MFVATAGGVLVTVNRRKGYIQPRLGVHEGLAPSAGAPTGWWHEVGICAPAAGAAMQQAGGRYGSMQCHWRLCCWRLCRWRLCCVKPSIKVVGCSACSRALLCLPITNRLQQLPPFHKCPCDGPTFLTSDRLSLAHSLARLCSGRHSSSRLTSPDDRCGSSDRKYSARSI